MTCCEGSIFMVHTPSRSLLPGSVILRDDASREKHRAPSCPSLAIPFPSSVGDLTWRHITLPLLSSSITDDAGLVIECGTFVGVSVGQEGEEGC
jgi:hypothetical protein